MGEIIVAQWSGSFWDLFSKLKGEFLGPKSYNTTLTGLSDDVGS